jgi:hypothetical protein
VSGDFSRLFRAQYGINPGGCLAPWSGSAPLF